MDLEKLLWVLFYAGPGAFGALTLSITTVAGTSALAQLIWDGVRVLVK